MKSYWITVTEGYFKKIVEKQFFKVDEANAFYNEMQEKYKDQRSENGSLYTVIKELY